MCRYAIVVVGYNRIPGMMRLLNSLECAEYGDDQVNLIISLDNSGNQEVPRAAEGFEWSHGEKYVRTFPERQGLRKHILACGDFLNHYDAIAVLEDDIVVAPGFYGYMKQAVEYYQNNEKIAGISLYTHRINVNTHMPFIPAVGISDVFFMQFAQSWGQVWMKKQWFEFEKWYEENKDEPIEADNVPRYVSGWPKTSWLKYHIKYCIAKNKYFVYPYDSLTTCFSDVGEHCKDENAYFQVAMVSQSGKEYRFCDLIEGCKYDAFFEREGLAQYLNVSEEELCVDLYGTKHARTRNRYVLSMEELPYQKVKMFALNMRPHEDNIIYNVQGEDIYLYDTFKSAQVNKKKKYIKVAYYYNMTASLKQLWNYMWMRIINTIRKKVKK